MAVCVDRALLDAGHAPVAQAAPVSDRCPRSSFTRRPIRVHTRVATGTRLLSGARSSLSTQLVPGNNVPRELFVRPPCFLPLTILLCRELVFLPAAVPAFSTLAVASARLRKGIVPVTPRSRVWPDNHRTRSRRQRGKRRHACSRPRPRVRMRQREPAPRRPRRPLQRRGRTRDQRRVPRLLHGR